MPVLDPRQVKSSIVRWQQIAPWLVAQHTAIARVSVGQAMVQLPQWVTVLREVSQPSSSWLLQSPQPAEHRYSHRPAEHAELVVWYRSFDAGGHAWPQRPQLAASL